MTKLHPDFPDSTLNGDRWNLPNPLADIASAFDAQYGSGEKFTVDQVSSVELYSIRSEDGEWSPENDNIATELSMVLLGALADGRWFGLEAWNDYTGWGCQDNCDVFAAAERDDVIRNGLTEDGRSALGLTLT